SRLRGRPGLWIGSGLSSGQDSGLPKPLQDRESLNRRSIVAGMAAVLVTLLAGHFRSTPYNNYVLLSAALLHGHTWIAWPGAYLDALAYHGQHYVIEGPVPALLLLPYVAIAGSAANQTLLAAVLAGVA